MRILYDYQGLTQPVGGVSRCFCEYIKEIRKTNDVKIACPMTHNIYLHEILNIKTFSVQSQNSFRGRWFFEEQCNRVSSIFAIIKNDFDIFHPTFDKQFYYGKIIRKPYVITVHDMIPELYYSHDVNASTNLESFIKNKRRALKGASRIMCVSQNTRKEMLEYYSFINPDKVDVVYHGINVPNEKYIGNSLGRYILFVGQRQLYKNFLFTIKSLVPLFNKDKELKMICTGSGFTEAESKCICQLELQKRIINSGFVDEIHLSSLYHNALAFVFPSVYEGFGIPILEAFANGCPACVADTSCFPEVGGGAVDYFNPHNAESILSSVTKVVTDSDYASKLRNKGYERAKLFTWKSAADKVLQCYKKVIA